MEKNGQASFKQEGVTQEERVFPERPPLIPSYRPLVLCLPGSSFVDFLPPQLNITISIHSTLSRTAIVLNIFFPLCDATNNWMFTL